MAFDRGGRDRGGDREDRLLGLENRADLAEQARDVLRLDRDDDQAGAGHRLGVRVRDLDPVVAAELGDALFAADGGDDLPGSRQPELSRPPSSDSPIFPQPRMATRRRMERV